MESSFNLQEERTNVRFNSMLQHHRIYWLTWDLQEAFTTKKRIRCRSTQILIMKLQKFSRKMTGSWEQWMASAMIDRTDPHKVMTKKRIHLSLCGKFGERIE